MTNDTPDSLAPDGMAPDGTAPDGIAPDGMAPEGAASAPAAAAPAASRARTVATAPRPMAGFVTMFLWGLRLSWRRRRVVLSLIVAALGGMAIGSQASDPDVASDPTHGLWRLIDGDLLGLAIPVIALLMVAHGWTREIRERTLVFHLVRPVHRSTLFLARYAAGVVPAFAAAGTMLLALALTAGADVGLLTYGKIALVLAVAVAALGAVYYMLAATFKRGVVAGLVYTFVIEGMLGNMPGTIQRFALNYHARGLFHGFCDGDFSDASATVATQSAALEFRPQFTEGGEGIWKATAFPSAGSELLILAAVAAIALILGILAIRRRDFALKD